MHVALKNHYFIIIIQVFFFDIESIFRDIVLPESKLFLLDVLHRPPEKSGFIKYFDNSLKESNIFNIQECYLIGAFNINLLNGDKMLYDKQYHDS